VPVVLRIQLTSQRQFNAPWWAVALALLAALGFLQLGRWQWHRADQKRALAAAFEAGMAAPVTALGERPSAALPRYAQVSVTGIYDASHQFLLDNLIVNGQVGYEVLTPMQLGDGRWLMVNRGWVALPGHSRARLPAIGLPEGQARTVSGRLDELPVNALASGRAAPSGSDQAGAGAGSADWPKRTSFPTVAELAATLGHPLEPRQLLLAADATDGYLRDWKPASAGFGPERHLSYAIQWWGLGALSLFLLVFMNLEKK
jgi:surfeit locus 1 family protein